MSNKQPLRNPSVVIIGAGMSGILMAIKLKEAGIQDIIILEKAQRLGGTWRENTYPGITCDVPSHMYSYSFAPNPEWTQRFAPGSEIQQYFEDVAERYAIVDHIRFNETVTRCHYIDPKWELHTSQGNTLSADLVVCATGILHHPAYPNIDGLEDFAGPCFHTARWDHSVDLAGKRVGIIGTGSTACQVIPQLQKTASHLSVFQRTAQWVAPQPNCRYDAKTRHKFRSREGYLAKVRRHQMRFFEQTFSKAVIGKKIPHLLMSMAAKGHLYWQVRDPQLRRKLTPDYTVGCKRLIFSSLFYPALQQANVHLETNNITGIEANGVRTDDGQLHELDALVLSTGFHPFNFMRPMDLRGRDGLSIDQAWQRKIQAYRSVCLPEFPNFFLMLGPNTPIGNYSVIAMSEVQSHYVMQLIEAWRSGHLQTIEASEQAKQSFNTFLREGMSHTVWLGGCNSWYLDDDGDPVMWPYTWQQWQRVMAAPEFNDFVTTGADTSAYTPGQQHSTEQAVPVSAHS